MSDFKITREIVQEAAELGISQLTGVYAPQSVDYSGHEVHHTDLEALALDPEFSLFADLGRQIIRESRTPESNPLVRVSFKCPGGLRRARRDEDFAGQHHTDSYAITDGFSLLCAIDPRKDEVLHSAGRGCVARVSDFQQKSYTGGMVLLAQGQFGAQILPESSDLGLTWHTGVRRERGKLLMVDFSFGDFPYLLTIDDYAV